MEWGAQLERLYDIQKEMGVTPPALKNRPVLPHLVRKYMDFFQDIDETDRPYTHGFPMRLNTRVITDYWLVYQIGKIISLEDFIDKMKMYDRLWMKLYQDKEEKLQKQKKAGKK